MEVKRMQNPMFRDFNSEEKAYNAVVKMKQKYDASQIKVIAPFPKETQSKKHENYGLPKGNVEYDGDMYSLEDSLKSCGFNEEQANILRDTIDSGQVIVIVCQNESN